MAVMVTGGAGYIGSHMVWRLLEAGEDVVVVDRLSTGFAPAVPADAELIVADVADRETVETVIRRNRVDAILHFAGSIVVPDSVRDPLGYYENNTCRSRGLIETAVACGVPHFVFSSTAAVYGTPGGGPVAEDAPLAPLSPYGRSKLMTETMLADAAAAHGLRYTVLRYFNVAGADPGLRAGQSTRGATHLVKLACEAALGRRRSLEIYGNDYATPDGTCVRDYVHVSDLVEAHWLALERLRRGGASLTANCGYGSGHSVLEVIEAVERVIGRRIDVRMRPRRPGDAEAVVADCALAQAELGWQARLDDLDQIVLHALRWEDRLMRGEGENHAA